MVLLFLHQVVSHDPDAEEGLVYCVHYAGWNMRYLA